MKLRNLRIQSQPRLMIIPMIDIIFFLLVFFMMSTMYMIEQNTMPVSLPQAAAATPDQQKQVAITLTAQGSIFIEREEIPPGLLAKRVQAEVARSPDAAFVLRSGRRLEYGRVVLVLDELKKLGVRRIALATEPGQGW
jgi:biopolymer transport protein ExbD